MAIQKRLMRNLFVLLAALLMAVSTTGCGGASSLAQKSESAAAKTVGAGETWVVSETTELGKLTVAEGAEIKAPEGYSVTLTVDGVETGQELATTKGVDNRFTAGVYEGDVVLTVTETNTVAYQGLNFPLRQAVYLDGTGVVASKSVLAAVDGSLGAGPDFDSLRIKSTGQNFNGIYVAGGEYTVRDTDIELFGNGRCDLIGYGAAITTNGEGARLVLDNVNISNQGVVRTAVVADGGSSVIVKNSTLVTRDGVLPEDYVPNADLAQMRGGFPVGGSTGNCRATNLLGTNTRASYINTSISAEGWGVLSSDGCTEPKLTAINCDVSIDGNIGGYGTYAIGDATETFLGCVFNVAFDISTLKGGFLIYGDSTPEAVAKLNADLDLRLTDQELAAIPNKANLINSDRFGIMCTGSGSVDISGGTIINTGETMFLNKGATVAFKVDGSQGAELNARNGVLMQLMDSDDPGPTGLPYTEPTEAPEKDSDWDLTATADASTAVFSNIDLTGDFYNSIGWGKAASSGGMSGGMPGGMGGGAGGPGGGDMPEGMGGGSPQGGMPGGSGGPDMAAGGPSGGGMPEGGMGGMPGGSGGAPGGGMMGGGGGSGKNMALTFDNASITGVISSTEAHHLKPVLHMNEDEYLLFGVVTNMAHPAINNGVIVSMTNGSEWTVTGTSYLNRLTVEAGSSITAPSGYKLAMTVDGVEKKISAGDYQGQIMLTVTKE